MAATIEFDRYATPDPLILVTGTAGTVGTTASSTVTCQELTDAIATYIDEPGNTDIPAISFTEGKTTTGPGKTSGITLLILGAWRIKFDDEAVETLGFISGGTLKPTNGDGEPVVAPATNVFYFSEHDISAGLAGVGMEETLKNLIYPLYAAL